MTAQEIEIKLPHITLAAKKWGEPGSMRGLALHGWLDNAASFDRLIPLLPTGEWIALDLPGHGRSEHHAPGYHYHLLDYLSDVHDVTRALGWDQFTLLGHSLGAAVASLFAAAAPALVNRLCLIDGLGPLGAEPDQSLDYLRRGLVDRSNENRKPLRYFPDLEQAIKARCQAGDLSPEAARFIVERGTRKTDSGYIWSSDSRLTLTSMSRLTEAQILNDLQGIQCPTLLLLADPSPPFFSEHMMTRRAQVVPQIKTLRIPGTHHLHLEDPEPVAQAITTFLGSE
jgi:pimeloyl-ACP methyl ester carboxylesterase